MNNINKYLKYKFKYLNNLNGGSLCKTQECNNPIYNIQHGLCHKCTDQLICKTPQCNNHTYNRQPGYCHLCKDQTICKTPECNNHTYNKQPGYCHQCKDQTICKTPECNYHTYNRQPGYCHQCKNNLTKTSLQINSWICDKVGCYKYTLDKKKGFCSLHTNIQPGYYNQCKTQDCNNPRYRQSRYCHNCKENSNRKLFLIPNIDS